jgi:hypothetical protein
MMPIAVSAPRCQETRIALRDRKIHVEASGLIDGNLMAFAHPLQAFEPSRGPIEGL